MSNNGSRHLQVYDSWNLACSLEDDIGNSPRDVLKEVRKIEKWAKGIIEFESDGIVTEVYSLSSPCRYIHFRICDRKRYDERRKEWDLPSRFKVITTDENGRESSTRMEDVPEDWNYDDEVNSILEWEPE